jgi:hypothetical protein
MVRSEDIEEFTEEQSLMGRLVHLFKTDSADQQYQVSGEHLLNLALHLLMYLIYGIRYGAQDMLL